VPTQTSVPAQTSALSQTSRTDVLAMPLTVFSTLILYEMPRVSAQPFWMYRPLPLSLFSRRVGMRLFG